jgi:uncharacterized protein (DUF2141 family)
VDRLAKIGILAAAMAWIGLGRAEPAPGPDKIRVEMLGLRSDSGTVYVTLYAAPGEGFPGDADKAVGSAHAKIAKGRAYCEMSGFAPGVYAVAMIHDENDNHKLDTNWLGIPTEGYGASRDAKARFGPPSFKDAAFTYSGGSVRIPIHVRYW